MVKSGTGALTLSAANTYSGGTAVSRGTFQTNNSSGAGTGTVTLGDADTNSADVAFLASATGLTFTNDFVVGANGTGTAAIGTAAGLAGAVNTLWNGALTLNRGVALQAGSADRTSFAGLISGTGDITVTGSAAANRVSFAQPVTTVNTFAGNVLVNSGTLQLFGKPTNQFIPDASGVSVAAGATLRLSLNASGGSNAETVGALTGAGTVIA